MKVSWVESAYETARKWAVHPISHPPPGWAQIVRSGVSAWVQAAPPPCAVSSLESHALPVGVSPLLTLVAAMIAEVCP
jgi:hypothetical protein